MCRPNEEPCQQAWRVGQRPPGRTALTVYVSRGLTDPPNDPGDTSSSPGQYNIYMSTNIQSAFSSKEMEVGNSLNVSSLPDCYFVHLRHSSAPSPTHVRILLIHGFRQDSSAWLPTAKRLHDVLGCSCLVPDLYGHGQSPYLPRVADLNVANLVAQLRKLIVQAGWDNSPVVLAGISMGGALAQLYSLRWPSNCSRLVLVASGGLSECAWHPLYLARKTLKLAVQVLASSGKADPGEGSWSLAHKVLSHLNLVSDAPEYRVPQNLISQHLARYPLTLIWGGCDFLHSSQFKTRCRGRTDVHVLFVPFASHFICSSIERLALEKFPQFWTTSAAPPPAANAKFILQHNRKNTSDFGFRVTARL